MFLRSVLVREHDGVVDLVVARPGARAVDPTPPHASVASIRRTASILGTVVEARRVGLDLDGAIRPAFLADVEVDGPGTRLLLVYDGDGDLLVAAPRSVHALGRVYVPNPPNAMNMTSDEELLNLTSADRLNGRFVRVATCNAGGSGCFPTQSAVADAAGDFLYDPVDPSYSDPFAEVSAYFHLDRVAGYFDDTHGYVWTCCGEEVPMDVVVNFVQRAGMPHDNASFSPPSCDSDRCGGIRLGQGRLKDYAYDGDVVYHEFVHAVVDELAGIVGIDVDTLGWSYEPMGINEGTADYFSATVAGDPDVAEYFTGASGIGGPGALRELDNGLRCPSDLFGEGHLDGRIWGGTCWRVRESIGATKADALVFATLASMVDNTNYADAAELLTSTADAMQTMGALTATDVEAVRAAVQETGLEGCQRIIPLDDGRQYSGYSGTSFPTGSLGGGVVPLHYSVEIPPDVTSVRLNFTRLTRTGGDYTWYFRHGRPLFYAATRRPPLIFDASTPAEMRVTLTPDGDVPLPRCQTLYIGLIAEGLNELGESVYQISARVERSGELTECAELVPGVEVRAAELSLGGELGGGGCDCRAIPPDDGDAPVPLLPALVLVLAVARAAARRR